jgi:hypothetical protein
MSSTESNAWQAFMLVVYGFLGEKSDIYREIGENLIEQYHFFVEYLWNFTFCTHTGTNSGYNWGDVNKEHGELPLGVLKSRRRDNTEQEMQQ